MASATAEAICVSGTVAEAAIDSRIAAAEESLGHYVSAEESQRTAASLDELRNQRNALLAEWESLASTLEEQSSTTV